MPATIFSTASQPVSIGASRRSSISRVNWNSAISGMATAWMPEITMLMAMMPGSSTFLYAPCIIPLGGEHAAEDEGEQQRLQQVLHQHGNQVAAGHMPVARKQGEKSFPVQSRRLLPV